MSEDIPDNGYALPLVWAVEAKPLLDSPYIVKNVVAPGELFVIYGAPKSGKTFLAIDLALRVAAGIEWFGHKVKRGPVIYVASEMGNLIQRRVVAWMDLHREEIDEVPLAIIPKVVNLLDEVSVERLFATLATLTEENSKPSMIVIDTLARSMTGGDENTAKDMGRVIGITDRVRDTFQAATGLVHHGGKDSTKGTRGSSALLGAVDTAILVEADDIGNHHALIEWSRNSQSGEDHAFRLPAIVVGKDDEGDDVTTCTLNQSDKFPGKKKTMRVDVALLSLAEAVNDQGTKINGSSSIPAGSMAVTLEQWKNRWCLRTGYDETDERNVAANFSKDKRLLLAAGKIQISKPYVWMM